MFKKQQNFGGNFGSRPKSSIWSFLFLAVVVLVGATGSFFYLQIKNESAAIDKITHCHKQNLPVITLVLIDSSDPLDNVQRRRAISDLLLDVDQQAEFSRVDIYSSRPGGENLISPVFSQCKPPAPNSALYSDVKAAEKFEEDFRNGLIKAFDEASGMPSSETSPILESVREAAANSFSGSSPQSRRRLIIISDMLQNSDNLSHYKGQATFESFQKSSGWPNAIADLGNAEVSIKYITRAKTRSLQGIKHQEWWRDYFEAVNGYLKDVESY